MNATRFTTVFATLALAAGTLRAQQPNGNAAAFGMAGNFTAAARNYDAVAWNPANLALPGNSVASFNIGGLGGTTGLAPVDLQMLARFNGPASIPDATRDSWLQLIGDGREHGRVDAGISLFSMSVKNVALQVGTSGYGNATIDRYAAEVLLYGNAGRSGPFPQTAFTGSSAEGAAFTTAAASIGFPLPITLTSSPDEIVTLGITGKYVIGSAFARAQDDGSTVSPSGTNVSFPLIFGRGENLGHGVGMDVGLAWHSGRVTVGLAMKNAFNTFAWDTTKLSARLATANYDGTTNAANFGDTAYAFAPAAMRAAVAAQRFSPSVGGGVSLQAADMLLLTADVHVQTGDAIPIGPRSQVGAGLQFSGIHFLPITLGAAKITDGWQGAAGVGLILGENHIGVSAMTRDRDGGRATGVMVNVLAFY